jgi:hypothetical protein
MVIELSGALAPFSFLVNKSKVSLKFQLMCKHCKKNSVLWLSELIYLSVCKV